jgi:CHAT domain-containing protein/tetratricopeptide (TPR) repeat protein
MAPELAERIRQLEASLEILRDGGDILQQVNLLRELGVRRNQAHRPEAALAATCRALCLLARARLHQSQLGAILRLDLADRWMATNRLPQAVVGYRRSVTELQRTHGPNSKAYWAARNRWGVAAATAGEFDVARRELEAVVEYQRHAAIADAAVKPDLVVGLLDLIRFERSVGRLDNAATLLDEAGQLSKELKDHDLLADVFEQLGALATRQKEFEHAVKFHSTAHLVRSQRLGTTHPLTLHSLTALGEAFARWGRLDEARRILEEARSHGTQAALDRALCETILAEVLFRKGENGPGHEAFAKVTEQFDSMNHRLTAVTHRDAAIMAFQAGHWKQAADHAFAAIDSAARLWKSVQRYGSEADLLAWQAVTDVLSACAVVARADVAPLMRALLEFKGIVADTFTTARHSPGAHGLLVRLEEARARLRTLERGAAVTTAEVTAARRAVELVESEIAAQRPASPVRAVGESESAGWREGNARRVLLDFLRFQAPTPEHQFVPRYGVLVHGADPTPRWLDLGPAASPDGIDGRLERLQGLMRTRLLPADAEVCAAAEGLHAAIWEPIRKCMPEDCREVIVIPDGPLNLLSFGVLWDGAQFLGERVRFRYVSSFRAAMARPNGMAKAGPSVIVSDPDFDHATPGAGAVGAAVEMGRKVLSLLGLRGGDGMPSAYPRLGGSRLEGERVAASWAGAGITDFLHLRRREATKHAVRRCTSPRFLHIATHGHYVDGDGLPRNPMLRSWLAFAGVNRTLAALAQGRTPDLVDDGLLRADEIRAMELSGTELVVLSACDSGVGAIRSGEGVFGLRRAVHEAGARNLLLTLWPVSDQRTAEFIPRFYGRVHSGCAIAEALHLTQSEALERMRVDLGPAMAARLLGAFVLSEG